MRKFFLMMTCFFLLESIIPLFAFDFFDEKEYRCLDEIALETETDKSSNYHDYTRTYSMYLSKYKQTSIKFLEIGIGYGNSVKLWERYFPNAELHFIDNRPQLISYFSNRSHYHYFDQQDKDSLISLGREVKEGFDIIIDDGGHYMVDTIASFQALFPFLKKGGLYIIEDLNTSYWSLYGSFGTPENPQAGPGTVIQFLKDLIDDLNYTGARTWCADAKKTPVSLESTLNIYQKEIESIHFYNSLCIIIKR